MSYLAVARMQSKKKSVQLNVYGQPIGKNSKSLQSYIGVLVREKVKITYDNWKKVPIEVKDSIWTAVLVRS